MLGVAGGLSAQEPAGRVSGVRLQPMAQLIPLIVSTDPIPGGAGLTEVRLVQPMLGVEVAALSGRRQASRDVQR